MSKVFLNGDLGTISFKILVLNSKITKIIHTCNIQTGLKTEIKKCKKCNYFKICTDTLNVLEKYKGGNNE